MSEPDEARPQVPGNPGLLALRDALRNTDRAIIEHLAERMRLIGQVASYKVAEGLPAFDREREQAHLGDLLAMATAQGLAPELARDVFGVLFSASRAEQRRAQRVSVDPFRIGVIGGTAGMGEFLARVCTAAGHVVEVSGIEQAPSNIEIAGRNDLVVIAVPIAATEQVIREIAPHLRDGACLMDVTSIKAEPLAAMLDAAPARVSVVGTHPMFGTTGQDFDRQKVVLCRGRGDEWFARIKRLYELLGAECIEATAEEHDAQMALIQVLVHEKTMVLGSVLERLKASLSRSLQFASPIYRTELAMVGRMFSQGADLYADILTKNKDAARYSHVFEQEAAHFARAVAMGDRDTVIKRFKEVSVFMADFATWAKTQSDAILQDLVRHG